MTIEPCNNCKKNNSCLTAQYVKENLGRRSPWVLADTVRGMKTAPAEVASVNLEKNYCLLECSDFQAIKKVADYSKLRGRYRNPEEDCCETRARCSGNCKDECDK